MAWPDDRESLRCALAQWNVKDLIFKGRPFGLTKTARGITARTAACHRACPPCPFQVLHQRTIGGIIPPALISPPNSMSFYRHARLPRMRFFTKNPPEFHEP